MTKENPNTTARKMLENMVRLAGRKPRHIWDLRTIVPADFNPKPLRPTELKPWEC